MDAIDRDARNEIVILIHGTGAGIADQKNPRWWQSESKFARSLVANLGSRYELGEPALWGNGGANSEVARRTGGEALLARLIELEKRNVPYHLVAHSHGGSVIWHALTQSAGRNARLRHLRSWTTVGTPFLQFEPDRYQFWQLAGFVASALAMVLLWPQLSTLLGERSVVFAEGSVWALAGLLGLGALLIGLFAYFFFRIVLLGVQLNSAAATRRAERQAAEWYGDRWMALWHDRDEPISGLQATLSDPPTLIPRLASPRRPAALRVLLIPYDRLLAPIGDAFAWAAVMSKAQGSDELGRAMTRAAPAPDALAPGWPPVFASLATMLKDSADARAGVSAGRLRDALAAAAKETSGQGALIELAKVIGWDELIHTSYFGAGELCAVIEAHIAGKPIPSTVPPTFVRLPRAETVNAERHRSMLLPATTAAIAALATFGLAAGFYGTYRAGIEPLTAAAQIAAVGNSFEQRRFLGAIEGRTAGRVMSSLLAADALPPRSKKPFAHDISRRVFGAVEGMPHEEQIFAALQTTFFHLGARGREADLRNLLADISVALDHALNTKFEAVLALSAELGYRAGGKRPFADLVRIAGKIITVPDQSGSDALRLSVALPFLLRNGRLDEATAITRDAAEQRENVNDCFRSLVGLVGAWARAGSDSMAMDLASRCKDTNQRLRLSLEAASQLGGQGGQANVEKASKILAGIDAPLMQNFVMAAKWNIPGIARLLVLQGRAADAKRWIFESIPDVRSDALLGGWRAGKLIYADGFDAAVEMARRGQREDATETVTRLIEAEGGEADRYRPAIEEIKLAAGVTSREDIRREAENLIDLSRAGEKPFGQAAASVLSASLFALVGARKEAGEALAFGLSTILKLQPDTNRANRAREAIGLAEYLDAGGLSELTVVSTIIAGQQEKVQTGDDVLRALSEALVRQKSLFAARRSAERIATVNMQLDTFAAVLAAHVAKRNPSDTVDFVSEARALQIIPMNTELPGAR